MNGKGCMHVHSVFGFELYIRFYEENNWKSKYYIKY